MNKVFLIFVALLSVTSLYKNGLLASKTETNFAETHSFCINQTNSKFYSVLSVGVGSSLVKNLKFHFKRIFKKYEI